MIFLIDYSFLIDFSQAFYVDRAIAIGSGAASGEQVILNAFSSLGGTPTATTGTYVPVQSRKNNQSKKSINENQSNKIN